MDKRDEAPLFEKTRNEIVEKFGQVFEACFTGGLVSVEQLEWHLKFSPEVRQLERGFDDMFTDLLFVSFFKRMFGIEDERKIVVGENGKAFWVGQTYARFFFASHLSFSALMLIFPIEEMMDLYLTFHESTEKSLFALLDERVKKTNILLCAIKRSGLSVPKLALRTGVKKWTLISYERSMETLYGAGIRNVYSISRALEQPIECFVGPLW